MAATPKTMQRTYRCRPDLPDHRDRLYQDIAPERIRLPAKVDLRDRCPPVVNQGQLNCCTANACAAALEYVDLISPPRHEAFVNCSRLFMYYNARVIERVVNENAEVGLRHVIKGVSHEGVCAEQEWPYDIKKVYQKPQARAYKDAKKHQVSSYHRLKTTKGLKELLTCLAEGFPFLFIFSVYESFENPKVAKTGIIPMPKGTEQLLGGHCVCAVGYDQAKKMFLVRNSFGEKWGQGGYCWMPFEMVEKIGSSFWTIR